MASWGIFRVFLPVSVFEILFWLQLSRNCGIKGACKEASMCFYDYCLWAVVDWPRPQYSCPDQHRRGSALSANDNPTTHTHSTQANGNVTETKKPSLIHKNPGHAETQSPESARIMMTTLSQ
jgi:hypothetical protein